MQGRESICITTQGSGSRLKWETKPETVQINLWETDLAPGELRALGRMCQVPRAAATKYHTQGGLKPQKCVLSHSWSPEVWTEVSAGPRSL